MRCVFHSVGDDDKHCVARHIFGADIFVDCFDMLNTVADCVDERSASAGAIVFFVHRLDLQERHSVMERLKSVVKQNCCDKTFAVDFLLF